LNELCKNWHVAYHGTKFTKLESIVKVGLVPPGTFLDDGKTMIVNINGKVGAKNGIIPIFLSPSIEYAANELYTKPQFHNGNYVYAVFQVRVRPGKFRVQQNTLHRDYWEDKNILYDTLFGPHELEWLVEDPDDVRVTGLMIKTETKSPKELNTERFALNKNVVMTRQKETEKPGKWYWNCDPNYTLSEKGNFKEYGQAESANLESAYKYGQSAVWIGSLKTDRGDVPYFVNFTIMEQLNCVENTRRRKVKRVPIT